MNPFTTASLLFLTLFITSCKNDIETSSGNSKLLFDGPYSPGLGKQLDPKYRYFTYTNTWGRDHNEIFLTTSTGVTRINLEMGEEEILDNNGGAARWQTGGNTGVVFLGEKNGVKGQYLYNYSTNSVEPLVSISRGYVFDVFISGTGMFLFTDSLSPAAIPCTTPWDYWCGNTIRKNTFYHFNKSTKLLTQLAGRSFMMFSKDGSRALLNGPYFQIVDSGSDNVIDSFMNNLTFGEKYLDDVLKTASYDYTLYQEALDITNEKTHQLIKKIPVKTYYPRGVNWSFDGKYVYYTGNTKRDYSGDIVVCMVNISTGEEKEIARSSVAPDRLWLSNNNKRMLMQVGDVYYVKDITF